MKVSPISYNRYISNKSTNTSDAKQQKAHITNKPLSPAKIGVVAGVGAFGVGFMFDRACAYMFNMMRNIKTSLVLNTTVGIALGAYTYIQAKNALNSESKEKI